jgi:polar amino acid transport system substrate-binding protein
MTQRTRWIAALLLTLAALSPARPVGAQSLPAETSRELVVGIKETPPFVVRAGDGRWTGISIELWRRIAAKLGLRFTFREYDLEGLLGGLERGEVDVVTAALTVTAAREQRFDFTHPFYASGLGIAVSSQEGDGWLGALGGFFSLRFLKVVGGLFGLLLFVGVLVWFFERRHNVEEFGGKPATGLASGFWFSAVTMTTVGYGDKSPRTVGGRLVALVWMFGSVIIISSFTAAIASALTIKNLESSVRGPADLPSVRVASVPLSTSAGYLDRNSVIYARSATPEAALRAVADKKAEAAVYDAPILKHLCRVKFPKSLRVLSSTFDRQDYAFAVPSGSKLREGINRVLLEQIDGAWWRELVKQKLGD